ncbi:hypothetical protein GPECTOR_37g176 [Gonium pectorale]|uniref:TRP C-terminal domain-containing protein n=1 Tax=Gonium pectorale TaxID=33097 RepID=A0A150GCV0_GONPE|nr:hypothetical protein GPECTOR_37g176 [Gonium pectorale]|eukprot:KXZ47170.1 hypothetical protein GPECTOR_37g176 [Gonium pectorale]
MAQECYSGVHLSLYVPIGIAAVILVCLAPPAGSFALLWFHRGKLTRTDIRRRYGFLYTRYKEKYFWWESVLMLEELVLVAVEVFGRSLPEVSHQILLMLAAFIAISVVNMTCAPVRNHAIILLEFLSLGVLSLTVTLSLYFVVSDNLPVGPAPSSSWVRHRSWGGSSSGGGSSRQDSNRRQTSRQRSGKAGLEQVAEEEKPEPVQAQVQGAPVLDHDLGVEGAFVIVTRTPAAPRT